MHRIFNRDRLGRFARAAWNAGVSIMKRIVLLGAAPIDGEMRYPSQGSIEVTPTVADELEKAGLAKPDDLDKTKVDDLREIALAEGADVGPGALKADVVTAIRGHRSNEA